MGTPLPEWVQTSISLPTKLCPRRPAPVGPASARGGGPAGRRGPVQVPWRPPEEEGTSPWVRPTQRRSPVPTLRLHASGSARGRWKPS